MARLWSAKYKGMNPDWTKGQRIQIEEACNRNPQYKDDVFVVAFEAYLDDEWWAKTQHCPKGFYEHTTKWLDLLTIGPEDYKEKGSE